MDMRSFLVEMKYASEGLIEKIWHEHNALAELNRQIRVLSRRVESEYQAAIGLQRYAEDPDDVMMGVGRYWENYFGDDKTLHHMSAGEVTLREKLQSHGFSISQLSGSLLAFAKQGLSTVHGSKSSAPQGRPIGTQHLRDVIWEARNQAAHWEEGNFRQPVTDCFNAFATDIDPKFGSFATRNMAFDVVEVLGWKDFASFEKDMLSLA
ncbi:MAG: hypothetical protein RLY93_06150 [Sumerlaeia bacterium]